jgi:Putative threonine efflux protein
VSGVASLLGMPWPSYVAFLAVAAAVVLIPGPDFAVVVGNTLAGGRSRGMWCAAGICLSNAREATLWTTRRAGPAKGSCSCRPIPTCGRGVGT